MPHTRWDWVSLVATFVASVAVSALVFAYQYGQLEQRVVALEKQRNEQREEFRAEWTAARGRIEKVVNDIEADLQAMRDKR
jgi:hypothetical protein